MSAAVSPVPVLLRAFGWLVTALFGVRLLAAGLFLVYSLTIQPERWMVAVAVGALALCYVLAFGVGDGLRSGEWVAALGWLLYSVLAIAGAAIGIARLWALQHAPGVPWPQANALLLGQALLTAEIAFAVLGSLVILSHTHALRRVVAEPEADAPEPVGA